MWKLRDEAYVALESYRLLLLAVENVVKYETGVSSSDKSFTPSFVKIRPHLLELIYSNTGGRTDTVSPMCVPVMSIV
jgi:hypothetical protein